MSQSVETPDVLEQVPQPLVERALPGKLLRNLRESRQLTVGDVAQALKFSPRQIEALERDDFTSLPGTTFVRGFIRSYARWLKADPAPLLLMLEDETPAPAPEILAPEHTGPAMPRPNGQGRRVQILGGLLFAAVAALAVQYFQNGHWPVLSLPGINAKQAEPVAAPAAVVSQPVQDLPTPAVVPAEAAQPIAAGTTPLAQPGAALTMSPPAAPGAGLETKAMEVPVAGSSAPAVPAASSNGAIPAGSAIAPLPEPPVKPAGPPGHQLLFTFSGKSWVEVKDATGRVVLAQINAPGSRQVVPGKPPFQVVIGNATQVSLQMDERAIDLVPYIRAEVARLTVE